MMTKSEREQLAKLARARARLAKSEAAEREKILLSEAEDLLTAEFSAQDEMWAETLKIGEEGDRRRNEWIRAQCAKIGIPPPGAPQRVTMWLSRGPEYGDPSRRGELRRLAASRLAALTATAKRMIDAQCLETETALVRSGLESADALAFLEAMPTAEQLMPSLSLDDLGVTHWQPPVGAAAALLAPSTPADRKRKIVRQAIEANPGASDRKIAEIAGVDHKTVSKYRAAAGELPAGAGEIPGEIPAGQGDGGSS
jgi:hypothetical protein